MCAADREGGGRRLTRPRSLLTRGRFRRHPLRRRSSPRAPDRSAGPSWSRRYIGSSLISRCIHRRAVGAWWRSSRTLLPPGLLLGLLLAPLLAQPAEVAARARVSPATSDPRVSIAFLPVSMVFSSQGRSSHVSLTSLRALRRIEREPIGRCVSRTALRDGRFRLTSPVCEKSVDSCCSASGRPAMCRRLYDVIRPFRPCRGVV